jgi:hypothetical protein
VVKQRQRGPGLSRDTGSALNIYDGQTVRGRLCRLRPTIARKRMAKPRTLQGRSRPARVVVPRPVDGQPLQNDVDSGRSLARAGARADR